MPLDPNDASDQALAYLIIACDLARELTECAAAALCDMPLDAYQRFKAATLVRGGVRLRQIYRRRNRGAS